MSKRNRSSASPQPPTSSRQANTAVSPVVRYKIEATLLEDAHLGTGTGSAEVNALVARDRHGNPVIWATHLEGLLREAATRHWDETCAKKWFGASTNQRSSLVFTSLYHVDANNSPHKPLPWTPRVWRSTARVGRDGDSENRAPPLSDTLRAIEHVPKGTAFQGFVEAPRTIELEKLKRLLAEVDAIGHGRAGGSGRVEFEISECLKSRELPSGTASRWRLLLRNCDPLCITATAHPGNIVPTESYVPGRTLLGALAAWLLSVGKQEAAALLVSEKIRVGDALPLPPNLSLRSLAALEVLPAPLALQSVKTASESSLGGVPWWAGPTASTNRFNAIAPKNDEADERKGKPKRPEDDLYIARAGAAATWTSYRPDIRARLRCGRPDPHSADPELFTIEQISEDTRFVADLEGDPNDLARVLQALELVLTGDCWLRVGRAGVPVEIKEIEALEPVQATAHPANLGEAYLTLTSDLLLRDEHLRWRTRLPERGPFDLETHCQSGPIAVKIVDLKQDETAIYSFNGTARLWRLPAVAIRRGTVARIQGEDAIAALRKAAAQGHWLGERIHEGFGRFRIDADLPGVGAEPPGVGDKPTPSSSKSQAASPEEAACEATQAWWDAMLGKDGSTLFADDAPSLSQWFDLRTDLDNEANEEAKREATAPQERSEAIKRRLKPKPAGLRSWLHTAANEVLCHLGQLANAKSRQLYARLFVRRLRAESRKRQAEREGGQS